jgi:hypothetical protein
VPLNSAQLRLWDLEVLLRWEGEIDNSRLREVFGIQSVQASRLLAALSIEPTNTLGMTNDFEDPLPVRPEDHEALARAQSAAVDAEANPRPPMLTGPKRQHFLPRFYLDGFSRGGLVAIFDREKNEIRQQQPMNTAVIGHFYTMEDAEGRRRFELEALLSEYEGKAKPVIDKLVAAVPDLSADERSDLSIFIALAATRTPDMVHSVQALNGEMVKHTAKAYFADVDQTFARLRVDEKFAQESDDELHKQAEWMVKMVQTDGFIVKTDEKWAVGRAIEMALAAAPYVAGRHWRVVHRNNEKLSFITSDSPVYLNTVNPRPTSVYGVGFGSPDAFISFPLHQSCTLEMFGDSGNLEHKSAGRDYLRMVNLHIAKRCQRFVVGRDEALVKSLTEELGLASKKWLPKFSAN